MIANGNHKKKRIFQLEQDEGTILGQENLKLYITEYYKQLFGPPEDNCVSLDESRIEDVPQLTAVENDILAAPFSEKEVFEAISQMKNNKAPGPDGFPAEFYKKCWNIIKGDLLALFLDLFSKCQFQNFYQGWDDQAHTDCARRGAAYSNCFHAGQEHPGRGCGPS